MWSPPWPLTIAFLVGKVSSPKDPVFLGPDINPPPE